jgi:anti-anti-sigma regulatory factor
MQSTIQPEDNHIALELKGGVTARDVAELTGRLAASLNGGSTVVVRTRDLDDVDTSVLQMLVSLRKTVAAVRFEDPSEVFVSAVDRCALRRELLAGSKDGV